MWFAILAVSLFILLKAADYFVDTAELFGVKMKIPTFIIGATVVAFGTSLPELAVGISSILQGNAEIITGTVIGSNVSNIFLITGVALLMSSAFVVNFKKQAKEFLILLTTAILLSVFLWDYHFSLVEAIICVVMLVVYIVYILLYPHEEEEGEDEKEEEITWKTYMFFVVSGAGIFLGAEGTTKAIQEIALSLNIAKDVISLTLVALGTSLPELVVTIAAARKKQYSMILGNVIGSNIFNTLCVMGIPTLVGVFTANEFVVSDPIYRQFSIPMMIFATLLLLFLGVMKKTPRYFGVIYIACYLVFVLGSFFGLNLLGFFS